MIKLSLQMSRITFLPIQISHTKYIVHQTQAIGTPFTSHSSCHSYLTSPTPQHHHICSEGKGAIASEYDVGLEEAFWMRFAYHSLHKEEEGAVLLFDPFFGRGDGTVTAGSLFSVAAEDATEDFFGSRPVSFLGAFFGGIILLVCFLDGMVLLVRISVGRNTRCDILWV
jgi:hypothetical protein